MPDEEETERLREEQRRRARREAELAESTGPPDERQAHERRADKADYLREKLEEQADAPDE
ncbi:MAG TPA: hypothetical protein VFI54_27070 [Solirubrobacteraceae bacterium]|nr:hypothetical protein [Solirubrobacteraceae bacterium]